MSVTNPLEKLAIEYWYHALMVVSIIIFLLSGAGVLKAFPLIPTATISLGSFFIGLGEWVNHPLQTMLKPANAYHPGGILSGHPRNNKPIGVIFVIFGFALVFFGLYKLVAA